MSSPNRKPGSGLDSLRIGTIHSATHLWLDASYKQGQIGLGIALYTNEKPMTWVVTNKDLGRDSTEGELYAIYFGLCRAREQGIKQLHIHTDSSMAIWHLDIDTSTYTIANTIKEEFKHYQGLHFTWEPRHKNQLANVLARTALGLTSTGMPGLSLKKLGTQYIKNWVPSDNLTQELS